MSVKVTTSQLMNDLFLTRKIPILPYGQNAVTVAEGVFSTNSNQPANRPDLAASNALDGSETTRWACMNQGTDEYIQFMFTNPVNVDVVTAILGCESNTSGYSVTINDCRIQVTTDGTNWSVISTNNINNKVITGNQSFEHNFEVTNTSSVKGIRMVGKFSSANTAYAAAKVQELNVLGG